MARYLRSTASADKRRTTSLKQRASPRGQWVDPYPWVHGTLPEKMVYAELSRLGIPFLYLNDIQFEISDLEFSKEYQADFVFPDIRLIIEVQGAYFHSMQKTIEADAFKFAVYEMTGWTVRAWWDYEILSGVQNLVIGEPLLRSLIRPTNSARPSELPVVKRSKVDTSQGIRTINQRRFRPKAVKVNKRKLRKGLFL